MIDIKVGSNCFREISTVIFDKDGTLIDSHIYWGRIIKRRAEAIVDYYKLNNSYKEIFIELLGFSLTKMRLKEEGPIALVSREEVIDIVKSYLETNFNIITNKDEINSIFAQQHLLFQNEITDYITLLPYVDTFLEKIKSIKNIWLITSDTDQNTDLCLKSTKIADYFNFVITKDTIDQPKKSGIPLKYALKNHNVSPKNCVVIGDAKMDYLMSKNAEVDNVILLSTGQNSIRNLDEFNKCNINSLDEIEIIFHH